MINKEYDLKNLEEYFWTLDRGEIYDTVISHVERILIQKSLERTFGNQIMAAKLLGINRNTLRTKIKKLDIDPEAFK